MKFVIAIITLCSSLLISTEAATCSFCDGVDVDQAIEITNGVTCGMATFAISTLEEGTEDCSSLQGAQAICCPEALLSDRTGGSCGFCAGAEVLVDANPEIPAEYAEMAGIMNCGTIAVFAEIGFNGTASECAELRLIEGTCCPGARSSSGTSPRYVQCVHVSYRACLHPAACSL